MGHAEPFDQFGSALTTDEFNFDGYSDLAVGVMFEDVGVLQTKDAGAVHIITARLAD